MKNANLQKRQIFKETDNMKQAMYAFLLYSFEKKIEEIGGDLNANLFIKRKDNAMLLVDDDIVIRFKFNRKGFKVIVDTPSELCSVKFDNDEYDVLRRRVRDIIND